MSSDLFKLVSKGAVTQISALLQGASPSERTAMLLSNDADGNTVLHVAAQLGQLEICRALIDQTADINLKNTSGVAPLFLAARQGHVDVVSLFLASGADPNTQDGQEATPLHKACESQLDAVALVIIKHETTQVDKQDLMGRTALHWCSTKGSAKVASAIIERGANLLKTKGGETAIHWAARSGNEPVLSLLLEKFPIGSVYQRSERGETAVDIAANDSIKDLLRAHAGSLGEHDTSSTKIDTSSTSVSVKKIVAPAAGAPKKKMTINLKK